MWLNPHWIRRICFLYKFNIKQTFQLRDDFIETPALPPDAVAWVVSDFQRESLEPSAVYQAATTILPSLHQRSPNEQLTDNFSIRGDKRPTKNIFSGTLMKPLKPTTAVPITTHNKTMEAKNVTLTTGNIALGILTAPSYTFYASRKILERSGFVLHTSRDVLEFLQTWLGVAYPLVKLGKLLRVFPFLRMSQSQQHKNIWHFNVTFI